MSKKFYTYANRFGNQIFLRGVRDDKRFTSKVIFNPSLWIQTHKESEWKTIQGKPVERLVFDSIKEANDYKNKFSDVSNMEIYGDIGYHYQYLHEKYPAVVDYDFNQLKIYAIDIETTVEYGFPDYKNPIEEILLITIVDIVTKETWTFGRRPVSYLPDNVNYNSHEDEEEMLNRFISHWSSNYPDIVTGWNTDEFDIPYLYNRIVRVCGETAANRLSPFGKIDEREYDVQNEKKTEYTLVGISSLDYLALYKKFAYATPENYKLDTIAELELGENKVENPYDTFKIFYESDWNTFVSYNIQDTRLIEKLENKRSLLKLAAAMAYVAKINFQDVFSPVKTWDVIIYNYLRYKNIIVPMPKYSSKNESIEGAFVKDPIRGMHEWVVSFDLNSLYPSIIRTLNMSPETIQDRMLDVTVDDLLKGDRPRNIQPGCSLAANGAMFNMIKPGFLAELMGIFYESRRKEKNKMLQYQQDLENERAISVPERIKELEAHISTQDTLQNAMKVLLNAAYGATANKGFRFYDTRIAEGITMTGQLIIRTAEHNANQMLYKIIGGEYKDRCITADTDSIYSSMEDLVDKFYSGKTKEQQASFLGKAASEKIAPFLNNSLSDLAKSMGGNPGLLVFKLECVGKGIFVAKKRYALYIYSNEGVIYTKPKLKVKGLEIVRSSTPTKIRKMLKDSVEFIFNHNEKEFQQLVSKYELEFMNLPIEEIAFPRSANNLINYSSANSIYKKGTGTPINVRASLLYNHYIKEFDLEKKYESIKEGDKIKYVMLKEPNKFRENVIAFSSKLPPEFGLHKFIDWDTMFIKTYLDPIGAIVDPIGWNPKEVGNLDDLFGDIDTTT